MQNYNLIHDVRDISNGEAGDAVGVLKSKFFDLTAGETSVEIDELENASILMLMRTTTPYEYTANPSPGNLEYTRTGGAVFGFNTQFNAGEKLFIMYYEGSAPFTYSEPVTVDELKSYLRLNGFIDVNGSTSDVDFSDDDSLLEEIITGARQYMEEALCISIVPKQWRVVVTNCAGEQTLPYGPVTGIVSFSNYEGTAITDYKMIGDSIGCPRGEKMTVTYSAGYANVPKPLKLALLKQCAWDYVNRGDENAGICEDALTKASEYSRKPILV